MEAMQNPPANGPNTEPLNQALLLQVTACCMRSREISKGNNENEEGAKKERIHPLKNMAE